MLDTNILRERREGIASLNRFRHAKFLLCTTTRQNLVFDKFSEIFVGSFVANVVDFDEAYDKACDNV